MSTNYLLRNTFWEERYNQLDKELKLHLQSLYSWALLINNVVDEKNRWINDKKTITGRKHPLAGQNVGTEEKAIANSIIQFVVSGKLNVNLSNTILNDGSNDPDNNIEVVVDDNDCNNDSDLETITESEAELSQEQRIANKLMRQQEEEQAELDRLINEKRRNMLEEQKDLMSSMQEPREIKFNLDVVGQQDLNQDLNQDQSSTTRADNLDFNVMSDECKAAIKKADEVKRAVEAQNFKNGELSTRPPRADPSTIIPDSEIPPSKVALEVAKAPVINALYRLDNWEREDLLERLFIKAEKNVKSLVGTNKSQKEIDELIHHEMDRLLEVYMKTH